MVSFFGRRDPVKRQIEKGIIREAVVKEKAKQRLLEFEAKKTRALERVRNPLSKKFKGIAVKAGKRARKDIGKSIRGFAEKIGKSDSGLGKPIDRKVGLDIGLLGKGPKKKRKKRELEPFRFF